MNPERRALLATLFLFALAATILHLAAHPVFAPDKDHPGASVFRPSFVSATLLPLLDLALVTWLFRAGRTAAYGYLLNGLIVIFGTVLMGHLGITRLAVLPASAPLVEWVFKSNGVDIILAWADFFAGKALYDSWMRGG